MSETKNIQPKRVLKVTPFSRQVELIEKSIMKNAGARSSSQYNNSGRFSSQQDFAGDARKNLLQLKQQQPPHNILQYQQQLQQLQGHHHGHHHQQPQLLYYKNEDDLFLKPSRQRHQHLQQQNQHQLQINYADVNDFSLPSLLLSDNSPHMSSYDYKNVLMMVNNSSNHSVSSPALQPQNAIQLSQSSSNGFFADSGSPAGQNLLTFPATAKANSNSPPSMLPSLGNGGVSNPSGAFLNSSPSFLPTTTSGGESTWNSTKLGPGNANSSIWGPSSFQKDLIGTFGDNNSSAVSGSYNSPVSGNFGSKMW